MFFLFSFIFALVVILVVFIWRKFGGSSGFPPSAPKKLIKNEEVFVSVFVYWLVLFFIFTSPNQFLGGGGGRGEEREKAEDIKGAKQKW